MEPFFARGACDDKGQVFMHIKALEVMLSEGELGCNIKFMIEGEEEVGSDNLEEFVKNNKEKLNCDIILISDTGMISKTQPSISTGLRGIELYGSNDYWTQSRFTLRIVWRIGCQPDQYIV